MQMMHTLIEGTPYSLPLPPPDVPVLPGLVWGRFDELFTPAYWCGQAWQATVAGRFLRLRLGRDLPEEVAACLMGGYGMKAELGLAAFLRLRDAGFLVPPFADASTLESELAHPFILRDRRRVRYRFPRQKARYLAGCLNALSGYVEPADDVALRDHLATMPGIGPKTASWIVRNHRGSDRVAVLDVHVLRAGRLMGLFQSGERVERHYGRLEMKFLALSAAIGARASLLDALIWSQMRLLNRA